jgi:group I intron endonuclease
MVDKGFTTTPVTAQPEPTSAEFRLYLVVGPCDKNYVGITGRSVSARWSDHVRTAKRGGKRSFLHAAIRKYGADAFSARQIGTYSTWGDVCAAEIGHIIALNTFAPDGYNLTKGGEGRLGAEVTKETRAKIRSASFLFRHTVESRAKIGLAHKGRPKSPEQCLKMSFARKGIPMSEAQRALRTGITPSDETRAKMSLSRMGKSPSAETRLKLSAASSGRKHSESTLAKMQGQKSDAHCAAMRKPKSAEGRENIRTAAIARSARKREQALGGVVELNLCHPPGPVL